MGVIVERSKAIDDGDTMTESTRSEEGSSLQVVVHSMARGCERSMVVEFRPIIPNESLPAFTAGSHIDVHVPGSRPGSPVLIRQYSLLNSESARDRYQIAVLREPASKGGSVGVHDSVRVGDVITISAPRNHFALDPGVAGRSFLLAGGIGITPIAAMAEALYARGSEFECHHYTASDTAAPLKEHLQQRPFADRIHYHSSAAGDGFSQLTQLPWDYSENDHLYICGPSGFLNHARELAGAKGWPSEAVHWEKFTMDEPVEVSGDAFRVKAASTGEVMDVDEEFTIAEVLETHGYEVNLSCEQGICGSCITGVLDGVPDHRDEVQSDAEHAANNQINVCCSRSKSAILNLDI